MTTAATLPIQQYLMAPIKATALMLVWVLVGVWVLLAAPLALAAIVYVLSSVMGGFIWLPVLIWYETGLWYLWAFLLWNVPGCVLVWSITKEWVNASNVMLSLMLWTAVLVIISVVRLSIQTF
jgi:hypothetical protein